MTENNQPFRTVTSLAHPSLAIAKYWGKLPEGINIPATTSVAVTLQAMSARTTVRLYHRDTEESDQDRVMLNGIVQTSRRFQPFFDAVRTELTRDPVPAHPDLDPVRLTFDVESRNDFPTAAGLASSAAGFAAMAAGCLAALTDQFDPDRASRLARTGSGSACRSIYGGFTRWSAGAESAQQLYPESWWPDLRVVVLPVTTAEKPLSSREAMNRTRDTSPYFRAWVEDAPALSGEVEQALANHDLERLGNAARLSYLRMFGTMISTAPPVLYWLPESVRIVQELETMRAQGIPVWETMDAGPQVKVFTDNDHALLVAEKFSEFVAAPPIISDVGSGVTTEYTDQ